MYLKSEVEDYVWQESTAGGVFAGQYSKVGVTGIVVRALACELGFVEQVWITDSTKPDEPRRIGWHVVIAEGDDPNRPPYSSLQEAKNELEALRIFAGRDPSTGLKVEAT